MTLDAQAILDALLAGTWPDPETGAPLSVPVQSIVIENSLDGDEVDLLRAIGFGRGSVLVYDRHTQEALGARVEAALSSRPEVRRVLLPDPVHADGDTVARLRAATAPADALIAVGAGSINDLCKYAAFLDGKPYAVFPTAPSQNGYASANAAISIDGMKRSLGARPPLGVFIDLAVLAAAPARMIRSGLGDSLCRPTAQADWLLSHLLRGTPYRGAPFALLAPDEPALLEDAAALLAGDVAAMARLARTLVLSGLGMVICGGSYPASQGEHLISHYVEMMGSADLPRSFHGEQVAVATLTMARLQQTLLDGPPPRLRPVPIDEIDLGDHFGPAVGRACTVELQAKALSPERAERLNARLETEWEPIRARIAAVAPPVEVLRSALQAVDAPTTPDALGWPAAFYRTAVLRARQIRDRYTFLDLAAETGLLERFAAAAA